MLHPRLGQWLLFVLTKLPDLVLWGCVLVLIWQLIFEVARHGPFTPRAAAMVLLLAGLCLAAPTLRPCSSTWVPT